MIPTRRARRRASIPRRFGIFDEHRYRGLRDFHAAVYAADAEPSGKTGRPVEGELRKQIINDVSVDVS